MSRAQLNETVLQGAPDLLKGVDGANVQVTPSNGGPNSLYRAATGLDTWTNPLTTRDGRVEPATQPGGEIWLDTGSYNLTVSYAAQFSTSTFQAVVGDDIALLTQTLGADGQSSIGHRTIYQLDRDLADVAILCSTDSVGAENPTNTPPDPHEWVYKLGQRLAARYPLYSVLFYPWDQNANIYRTPLSIQTGTGTHTLRMWGAGQAGHYVWEAEKYLDTLVAAPLMADGVTRGAQPDLILIGQGHNFSQGTTALKRSTVLTFCEVVAAAVPRAEIVLLPQNPETNDAARLTINATAGTFTYTVNGQTTGPLPYDIASGALQSAIRALSTVTGAVTVYGGPGTDWLYYILVFTGRARFPTISVDSTNLTGTAIAGANYPNGMYDWPEILKGIAQLRGYGFVDVHGAFAATEAFPGELTQTPGGSAPDGTHPTDGGYELWASTVADRMIPSAAQVTPRAQQPSSFSQVQNLLDSGDFPVFTPPAAPTNWIAQNTTLTKDYTSYDGVKGFSVRGTPTTAATSYISQSITGARLRPLLGQWVTLAARVRINNTDTQAGLPQLRATTPAGTTTAVASVTDEGQGAWRWNVVSLRVPADCTQLAAWLYFDFGSDGGGDASYDRAILTTGVLPRDMVPSPVDPFQTALVWMEADALATPPADGAGVASATDKSGRGNHLLQATGAKQPLYRATLGPNGYPTLEFDGVVSPNGDFVAAAFTVARPYTLFLVAKFLPASHDAVQYLLSNGGVGSLAGAVKRASDTTVVISSTTTSNPVTTTPTAWHLYIATFGTSPAGALAVDGSPDVPTANIGSGVPTGLVLGANTNGANGANAQIAAALMVPGIPSATDRATIRNYFKTKYGTP